MFEWSVPLMIDGEFKNWRVLASDEKKACQRAKRKAAKVYPRDEIYVSGKPLRMTQTCFA